MNWSQIFLILKREYFTRVKSKVFIITTLLIPLGFALYVGLVIGIQFWQSAPQQEIAIHDRTGELAPRLIRQNPERYTDRSDTPPDLLRNQVAEGVLDGYLLLTEAHITGGSVPEFIYSGSISITLQAGIRTELREAIREERLARAEVTTQVREIFEARVAMDTRRLTPAGEEEQDNAAFYSMLGFLLGFIIFFSLFMYGTMIMRGVIEEKTNRIIEVIASSVRPIDLLSGKILGITSVAVTQFAIWGVMLGAALLAAGPLVMMGAGDLADPATMDVMEGVDSIAFDIPAIPISLAVAFFTFFILGYFIYSGLFAIIGSAVDSESDTQQLMIPVFSLLILGFLLNIEVMQNPDSGLSVFGSLFPFFSPMNMTTRMAISTVPLWQLGLSLLFMAGTVAATMLLSARIYRVGILQYGGKAGFKDLFRWFRQD